MSCLTQYINKRKSRDAAFAKDFDSGYEDFKIMVQLRRTREKAVSPSPKTFPPAREARNSN